MKTNEDILHKLFDELVDNFREKLQTGEVTAAELNVIRQFLKDNSIEFIATGKSTEEEQAALAKVLPFAVNMDI